MENRQTRHDMAEQHYVRSQQEIDRQTWRKMICFNMGSKQGGKTCSKNVVCKILRKMKRKLQ